MWYHVLPKYLFKNIWRKKMPQRLNLQNVLKFQHLGVTTINVYISIKSPPEKTCQLYYPDSRGATNAPIFCQRT